MVTAPKLVPASFATEPYFGVTPSSSRTPGQVPLRPLPAPPGGRREVPGPRGGRQDAAELPDRRAGRAARRRPGEIRIVVQLAAEADKVDDATEVWPEDRPTVDSATYRSPEVADSDAAQHALAFDPLHLVHGIEASDVRCSRSAGPPTRFRDGGGSKHMRKQNPYRCSAMILGNGSATAGGDPALPADQSSASTRWAQVTAGPRRRRRTRRAWSCCSGRRPRQRHRACRLDRAGLTVRKGPAARRAASARWGRTPWNRQRCSGAARRYGAAPDEDEHRRAIQVAGTAAPASRSWSPVSVRSPSTAATSTWRMTSILS